MFRPVNERNEISNSEKSNCEVDALNVEKECLQA